jgi:hypothetical protein
LKTLSTDIRRSALVTVTPNVDPPNPVNPTKPVDTVDPETPTDPVDPTSQRSGITKTNTVTLGDEKCNQLLSPFTPTKPMIPRTTSIKVVLKPGYSAKFPYFPTRDCSGYATKVVYENPSGLSTKFVEIIDFLKTLSTDISRSALVTVTRLVDPAPPNVPVYTNDGDTFVGN